MKSLRATGAHRQPFLSSSCNLFPGWILQNVEHSGYDGLQRHRRDICLFPDAPTSNPGQQRASSGLQLYPLHQSNTRHDTMEHGLLFGHEVSTMFHSSWEDLNETLITPLPGNGIKTCPPTLSESLVLEYMSSTH